jgi:uncharacterized protein
VSRVDVGPAGPRDRSPRPVLHRIAMPPAGLRAAWSGFWRVVVFLLAFGGLAAAGLVPWGPRLGALARSHPLAIQPYGDAVTAVALLLATWLMTRFVDRRPLASAGHGPREAARHVALGLVIGGAWLAASLVAVWAAGWLAWRAGTGVRAGALAIALLSTVLNVVAQQLLFFGYAFRTIRARAGFPVTSLVLAALFSGAHIGAFRGSWLPAVNVFLAGAVFLVARERSGRLWLPIGAHFAWNALLGPVLGLTVSGRAVGLGERALAVGGPALWTGGAFGIEGGLVVTLVTLALIAALSARLPAR